MTSIHSEILTIMLVDMAGYTKATARLKREHFSQLHDAFDNISLPVFQKHGGDVIKKIGDAFLVTFKSPTNAVLCGMDLQNAFLEYNLNFKPIPLIKIRIVIHLGEVIYRNNDIYGDAVNITSRIEGITRPGDIIFTDSVFLAMNKNEIPYKHLGLKKFKGAKYPIRLFLVKRR